MRNSPKQGNRLDTSSAPQRNVASVLYRCREHILRIGSVRKCFCKINDRFCNFVIHSVSRFRYYKPKELQDYLFSFFIYVFRSVMNMYEAYNFFYLIKKLRTSVSFARSIFSCGGFCVVHFIPMLYFFLICFIFPKFPLLTHTFN